MATAPTATQRLLTWAGWLVPVGIVGLLLVLFVMADPTSGFRPVPPIEEVAVERTVLREGEITLDVRNDGPDATTIAQVLVNEAYAQHEMSDRTLSRLEKGTLQISYPWEEGLPLEIVLITSTGATVDHSIEVAAETPEADTSTLLTYALLGLYIGVIPVAAGLLWFPSLRRASRGALTFFLAFTIGLLGFLLLDTVAEGLELASMAGAALDGLSLFAIGAAAAVTALVALESRVARRGPESTGASEGLVLAYLVAAGIGLHNLGEGLAVGAALAAGEIALGRFLIIGFALHNTTEGLAIVSPLGREASRPALIHFIALGALAGAPTIVGAWAGGFAFTPAWASLAFGAAAGAIAQVVWQIGRSMSGSLASGLGAAGLMTGVLFMYLTGLLTA